VSAASSARTASARRNGRTIGVGSATLAPGDEMLQQRKPGIVDRDVGEA
jgi:hypothetical protein